MAVYQKAARSFGDDNFVFLVYDDPELFTPAGMDRVAELAAAVGPDADRRACCGSSRSTRCRCSGRSTTSCSTLDRLPAFARNLRPERGEADVKNVDLKTNAMTVGGAVRRGRRRRRSADAQGRG